MGMGIDRPPSCAASVDKAREEMEALRNTGVVYYMLSGYCGVTPSGSSALDIGEELLMSRFCNQGAGGCGLRYASGIRVQLVHIMSMDAPAR
ncbi:hypothetical protein CC2G_005205 [Coprinopsis cinerea AmutBmut pab1-1]|nr:hypothetical protein CC2G_005205 [Coprinopsis cinerea AmutBmut pab1-1]